MLEKIVLVSIGLLRSLFYIFELSLEDWRLREYYSNLSMN